jgi:hypothetical protein
LAGISSLNRIMCHSTGISTFLSDDSYVIFVTPSYKLLLSGSSKGIASTK